MVELSILIPARNEMFLKNTIEDILENIEADTEIIVVLDGSWAEPALIQHKKVKVVYLPVSIGQRAATNLACKLSSAKYVMKVDAHCAFDKGFDKKMLDKMQDNWTMVPIMRNLHAFDRVCNICGKREYQGPTLQCCGKDMVKEIMWIGKVSPQSTSYRFNTDLEFKYWGEYKRKQIGDIVDTMSLQGSCFLMTREKYLELNICDESWGSWGGQGAEVALKTWLSGGEVKCNKTTWYAHLFRTQGGDFSFPYPNPGNEQRKAKNTLRDTFLNDKWPNAKHKLQWLIDKFNPPEWESTSEKGIIYYTDNTHPLKISRKCQKQIQKSGLPITSSSLKPMAHFGNNEVIHEKRGLKAYFKQILSALERCNSKIVYFCEHDVLYHPSHFEFTPTEDKFYFNTNVWKWNMEKEYGLWVDDCKQVSGIVCFREKALEFYREKVRQIENDEFDRHYEPQNDRVGFKSEFPNVDIRHKGNFTKSRWKKEQFRNEKYSQGWKESKKIEGWDEIKFN